MIINPVIARFKHVEFFFQIEAYSHLWEWVLHGRALSSVIQEPLVSEHSTTMLTLVQMVLSKYTISESH